MIRIYSFAAVLMLTFEAHAFQTLCPGSTLATLPYSRPLVVTDGGTLSERIQRDNRHVQAMNAAAAIYDYGNYDSMFDNGVNLAAGLKNFVREFPAGYELAKIQSRGSQIPNPYINAESGLKFMIMAPKAGGTGPWILAIAGTQTVADWLMDLDLGRLQLQRMALLFELFTTCNQTGADNLAIPAHDFIITGHSLGGGLAQAFAYQMQVARREANLMPLRMELVTFNGFGAQPLVRKFGAYDSAIVQSLNAVNYYVHGDVVSRIGEHIGETRQLTPTGENPDSRVSIKEAANRHVMSTIKRLVSDQKLMMSGLSGALVRSPTEYKTLNRLMGLGVVGQIFAVGLYTRFTQDRIVETFEEALEIVVAERDQAVIQAMISMVRAASAQIDKASYGPVAAARADRLSRVLRRLISIRQIHIQP
jgi:hypothetical protein